MAYFSNYFVDATKLEIGMKVWYCLYLPVAKLAVVVDGMGYAVALALGDTTAAVVYAVGHLLHW